MMLIRKKIISHLQISFLSKKKQNKTTTATTKNKTTTTTTTKYSARK